MILENRLTDHEKKLMSDLVMKNDLILDYTCTLVYIDETFVGFGREKYKTCTISTR